MLVVIIACCEVLSFLFVCCCLCLKTFFGWYGCVVVYLLFSLSVAFCLECLFLFGLHVCVLFLLLC